ncbi:MAG: aldehyde dehydrogenase family protein, partial [Bacteroidales bacterium]
MKNIIDLQRAFYNTGATLDVEYRKKQLIIIRGLVHQYRPEIIEAFKRDYNKCEFDVYSTEIGMVLHELNYLINNIGRLSKPKRKCTSSINFPSKGYIMPEPYGVVLVVSPWNYPFNLSILPLAGAISA